jgi:hypothetical protein
MIESLRATLGVILVLLGIVIAGLGAWTVVHNRLPTWMKGIWKWPMGDNLTPDVARTLGWASLLAAAACPPSILVLIEWNRGFGVWLASMAAMLLVGAASFGVIWSVLLSRRAD